MFRVAYLKDLAERAVSAFATSVLSVLGGGTVNAWDMDVGLAVGVGLGAAVVTILKCLAVKNLGDQDTAGFISTKRD